ncbi:MAG: hypothetical protein J3Q66DRAFT_432919 [Benniella sp.]|nr:MAG: hypothetical protein J3Q66DRAFT_432919 [Benniella sp.]
MEHERSCFKKIPGGPMMTGMTCTMTNNGEDLFVLSRGTGYIYNVKSDSWSVFQNNRLPVDTNSLIATDPATGFMYIPEYGEDFSGMQVVLAVDTRTKTVINSQIPRMDVDNFYVAAWSAHLKSMLIFPRVNNPPYTFTPSETRKPTKGWGQMVVPDAKEIVLWDCVAPAYGGSKMVLLGKTMTTPEKGVIYTLDVVKRAWKGAPATGLLGIGACAVTGDQFIVWGGENDDDTKIKQSNATRVFSLKTEVDYKLHCSSSTDYDCYFDLVHLTTVTNTNTNRTTQGHINSSSREFLKGSLDRRDPSDFGPNSTGILSNPDSRRKSWLYRGPDGAPSPEHPHAIVDLEKRNVQEGAVEMWHPHAMVEQGFATEHNDIAERESIRSHSGKEDWIAS